MVDREIFSRRLEALRGYFERLRAFRKADETEFVREPALHDLAERYLHLSVEACLDLANHWIADRSLPTPDASRDTFTVLEKAGELGPELADRLRGWAGSPIGRSLLGTRVGLRGRRKFRDGGTWWDGGSQNRGSERWFDMLDETTKGSAP